MPLSKQEKLEYINLYNRAEKGDSLSKEEKKRFIDLDNIIENENIQPTEKKDEKSILQKLLSQYGEKYIKPGLELTGGALGGIAGATGGPLVAPITAGAGYAGGKQAYDILANLINPENKIRSIPQQIKEIPSEIAMGASSEVLGPAVGKVAAKGLNMAGKAALKGASSLYNIPKNAIQTYLKDPTAIKQMGQISPFETGMNIKKGLETAIEGRKAELNKMISSGLNEGEKLNATIDAKKVINSLKKSLNEIEPSTKQNIQYRKEIEDQINLFEKYNKEYERYIPVKVANQLKHDLQKATSYFDDMLKRNVTRQDPASDAFKEAASVLRKETVAELKNIAPQYGKAYKEFEELNEVAKNKDFVNAFTDQNVERTVKNLQSETGNKGYLQNLIQKADENLGTNLQKDTKNAFAAKYFNDPDVISLLGTGRVNWGPILGSGIGGAIGGLEGAGIGGASAALLSSPALFKAIAPSISKGTENIIKPSLLTGAQTTGREIPSLLAEYLKEKEKEENE
jgi:ribosome-binding factor A